MEMFHCNACGHLPHVPGIEQRRYFITNCGHIICGNCSNSSKELCKVCHANCKLVEVNQQSSAEIKAYFMDPAINLENQFKKFTKISNFQKTQAKNLQLLVTRLYDAYKKATNESASLKKTLNAAHEEISRLKRKIDTIEQEQQSWIGGGLHPEGSSFQMRMPNQPPPTPAFGSFFPDHGTEYRSQVYDTPSSGRGTPFTPSNMFTPANTTSRLSFGGPTSGGSSGGSSIVRPSPSPGIQFGSGRLIRNRTPNTFEELSHNGRMDQDRITSPASFCPAPGAGRPLRSPQGSDLSSRLRNLRCLAATPVKDSSGSDKN